MIFLVLVRINFVGILESGLFWVSFYGVGFVRLGLGFFDFEYLRKYLFRGVCENNSWEEEWKLLLVWVVWGIEFKRGIFRIR